MTEELNRILLGQSETHLVPWGQNARQIHRNMYAALTDLCKGAQGEGIELAIASAYRSFDRQVAIWNAKATGQRPILDDRGRALDFGTLTRAQILSGILRWSALPGTSRHHWGTDIDVFDAAAIPADSEVQLTTEEAQTRFAKLHAWLDRNMSRFGFFRPYARDLGGIAPEPWHLSYAPIARAYMEAYSYSALEQTLRASDLALKEHVLESLPQIFERYFQRVCPP